MGARRRGAASRIRHFDERGALPLVEIVIGSFLMLLLMVPIADLLTGLGATSGQNRNAVVAQNIAVGELQELKAETTGSAGFPPPDAACSPNSTATCPTTLDNATLTSPISTTYGGRTYQTYVVGGWCEQNSSSPYDFESFPALPSNNQTPPSYWVAIIVTWDTGTYSVTTSGTGNGPFIVSPNPHYVLTSIIATPQGEGNFADNTLPSLCPAAIE